MSRWLQPRIYPRVYPLAGILLLALTACTSTPPEEPGDGKPLRDITAADVTPAQPQAETILAAGNTSPYQVLGQEYQVLDAADGYRERGRASWYGQKFHGRKTANGEVFDAYAATAAHRSLPLPSFARVTNLANGRSLVVRVNDRGPFHSERIIDLSYGAAVKLGFAEQGTTAVEVVAISVEGTEDLRRKPALADWKSDYQFLQVASFSEPDAARRLSDQLTHQLEVPVAVRKVQVAGDTRYRVRVGPLPDRQQLLGLRDELESLGYGQATLLAD
jgi:rare lipoprotein A